MTGFLTRFLGGPAEVRGADISALVDAFWGIPSKTGVAVNVDTALQCTTMLACTQAIACGVGMLPLKLYKPRRDGGADPATEESLYHLMDLGPNDWQTSVEFIETWIIHAVLTGNGCTFINRVRDEVRELIPLMPNQVAPDLSAKYDLTYRLALRDGGSIELPRKDILHLRGPSWDSYKGLDYVRLAREAIGLALATEETQSRLHSNGARPGGVLSTDSVLTPDQIALIREQWQSVQGGVANAMKTAILQGGLKWSATTQSGVDGQHLETRKHQIEEICRALGVFPIMVGHAGDQSPTFASAEQFFLAHIIHTLSRWTRRIEKRLAKDLLTEKQKKAGFYFKFSFQALLRGDNKTRGEFYKALVTLGVLTRNEVRILEELNPLPGLDTPLVPISNAAAADPAALAKSIMTELRGHNGGPPLDDAEIEAKIGRVISAANEKLISGARDNLDQVLAQLATQPKE